MQTYKRAVKGQKKPRGFPADVYNRMIDLIESDDKRWRNTAVTQSAYRYGRGIVRVSNEGDARLDAFSVVGLDGLMFDFVDDMFSAFATDGILLKSAASAPGKPFAILQGTIEPLEVCEAVVSGPAFCQVNVTDENHRFANVADGETGHLESAPTGPVEILAKENGTGMKWSAVLLGAVPVGVRGVTKSSATQTEDRKATVQVALLDADFHETETVYDVRFSLFKPGEEIPSGLHVVVNTINWALDITATGCP